MPRKRLLALMMLALLLLGGFAARKAVLHEQAQNSRLSSLESLRADVSYLREKERQATEYYEYATQYRPDAFNYLAIGNSLTLIKSWGRGICSTRPDNDYFHLVVGRLEEKHGDVVAYPVNFAAWERSNDRDSTLDLLDVYLSDKLNLVTIQLGENVVDKSTFEKDLASLVAYVHGKAPKASIVLIGDFWDGDRNRIRQAAAQETGCPFADLKEIQQQPEYQARAGTPCQLPDGSDILVSKEAAGHPNDKGMAYIAQAVLNAAGE